jgi:two-component system alkaline phosphatase synthesis response regulator PhoP
MAYLMIVDDDNDFSETMVTVLKRDGHEIVVASNTEIALQNMKVRRPDLIVLDVMFPENKAAGFDLARMIQKDDKLAGIPIVMLTGVNDEYPFNFSSQDIDSEWLPVSEFLQKPVDFDVLRDKISALLNKKSKIA